MIVEGVYVQAAKCSRVALLMWAQIREDERRNGRADPEMIALAQELASVGRVHRMRGTSDQDIGTSGTAPGLTAIYSETTGQIATRLGISERMVRKKCQSGELPAVPLRGAWRIDPLRIAQADWPT